LENFVEDPLSEELLQGTFQGKNRINIDVYRDEDGKMKRLSFTGAVVEPTETPEKPAEETVGVGAGDEQGDAESEPKDE
jgi:ATP-dependent Clp protease ATP-binding subunit ClpC